MHVLQTIYIKGGGRGPCGTPILNFFNNFVWEFHLIFYKSKAPHIYRLSSSYKENIFFLHSKVRPFSYLTSVDSLPPVQEYIFFCSFKVPSKVYYYIDSFSLDMDISVPRQQLLKLL